MNLTPNRKLIIRGKLEPLEKTYSLESGKLFDEFEEKFEEFKGLVQPDVVIQLIEKRLKEELGEPKPPSPLYDKFPDQIDRMIEHTGLTQKEIGEMVQNKRAELKGLISEEGALFILQKELGIPEEEKISNILNEEIGDNMKEGFWDKVEIDSQEFPPWLTIKNGLTMELELVDPVKEPRPHKDKTFGRDQWIWDVKLISLDKEEAYKDSDKNGNPLYVKGRIYSLAMGKRAMQRFRTLWEENNFSIKKFRMKRTGAGFQTEYIFSA